MTRGSMYARRPSSSEPCSKYARANDTRAAASRICVCGRRTQLQQLTNGPGGMVSAAQCMKVQVPQPWCVRCRQGRVTGTQKERGSVLRGRRQAVLPYTTKQHQ